MYSLVCELYMKFILLKCSFYKLQYFHINRDRGPQLQSIIDFLLLQLNIFKKSSVYCSDIVQIIYIHRYCSDYLHPQILFRLSTSARLETIIPLCDRTYAYVQLGNCFAETLTLNCFQSFTCFTSP